MNTLTVRRARLSDLSIIGAIEQSCFAADLRCSPTALRRSLVSLSQSVWLAEIHTPDGRQVAGAMILRHYRRSLRIFSLAVFPQFQQCGVGGRLLKKAIQLARRGGFQSVTLEADNANRRLTQWYRKHGFEADYLMRDYYGPDRHGVHMRNFILPSRQTHLYEHS